MRATIMFSFILFAQLSDRRASTLNAVFASAFFICLFEPLSLFDVGFQLSYLAVLGILAFYPKLSKLLAIKNPMLRGVWNICCVSFAAQLAVLPLTIFYFHQVPVYFLLANVLVLPLVTVATYLIVLLLLVSFIPLLSSIVGYILGACVWVINYIVTAVQQLPYSVLDNIYLSPLQVSLCLLALLSLMLIISFRKKALLYGVVTCIALVLSLGAAHSITTGKQRQLVVFNTSYASFIAFVEGHRATCIRDNRSIDRSFDYNTNGYFIKQRVSKNSIQTVVHSELDLFSFSGNLRYYKNFFWFSGQSIKLLNSLETVCPEKPFPVDILIITNAFHSNINEVFNHYLPQMVVIDSSVSSWKIIEWETLLNRANIPYHNVKEKGAFVLSIY
jgi:competence protein ComEC